MACLFKKDINNWDEWSDVYQSIPDFSLLIEHIFEKENLSFDIIEHLTPGTNAVFKTGNFVIKIFAPNESGIDQSLDLKTELFSIKRCNETGISVPKLTAEGMIEDKYRFEYMITEYIKGTDFNEAVLKMTDREKVHIGRKLRELTDAMNTPCEIFNDIDVIKDMGRYKRWVNYPEKFKEERIEYIGLHDYGKSVFVHGDLCADNIIYTSNGELFIIDFADAVLAPVIYEHSLIAVELFRLKPEYLRGYFGNYSKDELADICFNGMLIHDFGGDIIKNYTDNFHEIDSLDKFKDVIVNAVKTRSF